MLRALLVALALAGQTAQNPAEMVTRSEAATFRARTNEVQVPVVVRDSKGETVGGLRAEDFRLSDKGKPQAIARLTPIDREGDAGRKETVGRVNNGVPAAPARFTVFLIDDVGSWSRQLRDAAIRYVGSEIRPDDRVAILATSRRYSIDFTDDPAKLADTWRELQIPQFVTSHPRMTLEEVRRVLQDMGRQALDGLRDSVRRLAVMPGERRIVFASNGFLTGDLVFYAGNRPVVLQIGLRDYENEVLEEAIRARITISSVRPVGLPARVDGGIEFNFEHALANLAYGTGGVFFKNNNDLDAGLREAASPGEHSYILTFSPQNLKYDGSFHDLKVTLPGRGSVLVQARAGYFAPARLNDPVETAKEELREALFSRDDIAELPAEVHTGFTRLGPDRARVNLQIHVGLEGMRFRKSEGRNEATLTVVVGLFDRNGTYAGGKTTDVELHLKDDSMQQWLRNGIKVGCNLDASPGPYMVRLVVRDADGRSMAAHNAAVNIP